MISTTINRAIYSGDGNTSAFAFPYPYLSQNDLVVVLRNSSGAEIVQTLTSNYTADPVADADSGGSITMVTAPDASSTLLIYRDKSQVQTLDLVTSGALPSASVETALDKVVMFVQRLQEQADRSAKLKRTDSSLTMEFPFLADRTGTLAGFDSSGRLQAVAYSSVHTGTIPVTPFWTNTLANTANASNSLVAQGISPWMIGNLLDDTGGSQALVTLGVSPFMVTVLDDTTAETARATLQTDLVRTDVLNSSFSLTANLNHIRADASSGAFTLSLPTAVGNGGKSIKIKKTDSTYNAVTINAVGGELIDAATTTKLTVPYDYIDVISDGTKWGISPRFKTQKSELVLARFRGHGSASTKILNFSTTEVSVGLGMALQMDTTVGAVVTINEEGLYWGSLNYKDATATFCGISRNQATLTDNIITIPETQRLALTDCPTNAYGHCSFMERLVVGDVIRPVTGGLASGGAESKFRIIKIAD